jgi:GLPGLI family protein
MKRQIVSIIFFIIPLITFSQEIISGKIIYKYQLKEKGFDGEGKSENIKSVFNNFNDNLVANKYKISFELVFNNDASYYKLVKNLESDYNKDLSFTILITGGNEEVFTSNKSDLKIKKIDVFGDFFLVKSKLKEAWKLTQESKKIDHYTCYKAILEKEFIDVNNKKKKLEIEAWYTPEIPVNFGPKGFGSLPGLILELNQGSFVFYAHKIEIKKNKTIIINPPSKGKTISEEAFSNLFRKIDEKKEKNRN